MTPNRLRALAALLIFAGITAFTSTPAEGPMLGFTEESAAAQRALEAQYDAHLDADNLRRWMKRMSAKPHHVGAPYGKENAEFMLGLFRSWGYDAEIVEYRVLFPTPKERVVELVAPTTYRAKLVEPELDEDATSKVHENRLPGYNAYSADGDVTAELVYVNYGIPEDYEALERMGIDVKGKIVLARYGRSWRGIKPKVAAEHGAVGCILYSDPRDDGYFRGDVYPKGPYRMKYGVQRGSVADMPLFPGDPLTPGVGATPEAERLSREEAPTLMKIPVLPISYGDAQPLLEALGGPVAPEDFRGALPLTYHVGPGPAKVHLKLAFDWKLTPAYNVIARLPGTEEPDQWIVRGNHHDAWVFGAADPLSGMVALLEEARVVGALAKTGRRPKRTIVYAAWDAEEPGLLGSTEWAEDHAAELRRKAVAYINSDGNGRGFLRVGGSHTLEPFVNEIARAVVDPQTGVTVEERLRARLRTNGDEEADTRADLRIAPLGSGSDYTPFLQHLGIASLNIGYGGENGGGSYHSIFDSFDYYTRFGDPGFAYGIALAQTAGRATLRLANADALPFTFSGFTDNVGRYVKEVEKLADEMREQTRRKNRLLEARAYVLAADPKKPYVPPTLEPPVPYLNFAPLRNALDRLEASSRTFESLRAAAPHLPPQTRQALDDVLMHSERAMTREEGLPRRPWFKHHIYAPGFYTGYGVKTLPGVREAIEERDWEEAEEHIRIAAATLERIAGEIDRAVALMRETGTGD